MPFAFFLIAPYVLLQNTLAHKVEWRGREYQLDAAAALAVRPAPAAPALRLLPRRAA
jgi:hypothetical protein